MATRKELLVNEQHTERWTKGTGRQGWMRPSRAAESLGLSRGYVTELQHKGTFETRTREVMTQGERQEVVAARKRALRATEVVPGISAMDKLRFEGKVSRGEGDECDLWVGADANGYGHLRLGGANGTNEYAHRVAYRLAYGSIPDGAHIRHACDTPACVTPAHLMAGSVADNMRDRDERGRGRSRLPQAVTDEIEACWQRGDNVMTTVLRTIDADPTGQGASGITVRKHFARLEEAENDRS